MNRLITYNKDQYKGFKEKVCFQLKESAQILA